jgi:hypothetical protein
VFFIIHGQLRLTCCCPSAVPSSCMHGCHDSSSPSSATAVITTAVRHSASLPQQLTAVAAAAAGLQACAYRPPPLSRLYWLWPRRPRQRGTGPGEPGCDMLLCHCICYCALSSLHANHCRHSACGSCAGAFESRHSMMHVAVAALTRGAALVLSCADTALHKLVAICLIVLPAAGDG